MYLHIIDDVLTMNHFIRRVQSIDFGQHHFVVINSSGHISQVVQTPLMVVFVPSNKNIQKLARSLDRYSAVFIHNLCLIKSKIVLEASDDIVFVWGIWGTDYYSTFPELYSNLFLPYTRITNVLLGKLSLTVKYIHRKTQPITHLIGLKSKEWIQQQAVSKFEFTFNDMTRHSEVFRFVKMETSQRFHLTYYSIESLTYDLTSIPPHLGPNILIGNSASNTSNHLDALIALRTHIIGRKIIVPLGYGSSRYRKFINLAGRAILKDQYSPINVRLPLPEYHQQLLSCNVMIFNHTRAQGLGNIVFGVWAGHKIFLRKSNPIFSYLIDLGIKVFPIESTWTVDSFESLPVNWQEKNRKIIELQYNEDKVQSDLQYILNHLNATKTSQQNKIIPRPSRVHDHSGRCI